MRSVGGRQKTEVVQRAFHPGFWLSSSRSGADLKYLATGCSFVVLTTMQNISEAENEARMLRGELYHAFMPELTAKRKRCHHACHRFNIAGEASRRRLVELWRE
jgi:hypothetical protein